MSEFAIIPIKLTGRDKKMAGAGQTSRADAQIGAETRKHPITDPPLVHAKDFDRALGHKPSAYVKGRGAETRKHPITDPPLVHVEDFDRALGQGE